jgi:uncharacterized Zn finger protein
MCKHVAAVLYGIGAQLDHRPELLFTLRKVDQQGLIANAGSGLSKKKPTGPDGTKVLVSDDLSEMFGIEMASVTPRKRAAASTVAAKPATAGNANVSSKPMSVSGAQKLREPASKRRGGTQRLTPAKRRAISERMRELWATRRAREEN